MSEKARKKYLNSKQFTHKNKNIFLNVIMKNLKLASTSLIDFYLKLPKVIVC